jgi:hypothetical protein
MKLCKDCKWRKPYTTGYGRDLSTCICPAVLEVAGHGQIDLVTGKPKCVDVFAENERNRLSAARCSPDAQYFEPKPPSPWRGILPWLR